jgi:hypothetical protein
MIHRPPTQDAAMACPVSPVDARARRLAPAPVRQRVVRTRAGTARAPMVTR